MIRRVSARKSWPPWPAVRRPIFAPFVKTPAHSPTGSAASARKNRRPTPPIPPTRSSTKTTRRFSFTTARSMRSCTRKNIRQWASSGRPHCTSRSRQPAWTPVCTSPGAQATLRWSSTKRRRTPATHSSTHTSSRQTRCVFFGSPASRTCRVRASSILIIPSTTTVAGLF